jgi:hypothetical protein
MTSTKADVIKHVWDFHLRGSKQASTQYSKFKALFGNKDQTQAKTNIEQQLLLFTHMHILAMESQGWRLMLLSQAGVEQLPLVVERPNLLPTPQLVLPPPDQPEPAGELCSRCRCSVDPPSEQIPSMEHLSTEHCSSPLSEIPTDFLSDSDYLAQMHFTDLEILAVESELDLSPRLFAFSNESLVSRKRSGEAVQNTKRQRCAE